MQIIATSILIFSFIFILILKENFIYFIIPLNYLIDLVSGFFPTGGLLAIIRAIIILFFFAYILVKYNRFRLNRLPIILIVSFLLLLLVQVILSADISKSLSEYVKTFIILLSFIISYKIFSSGKNINKLLRSFFPIFLLTIINILLSNFFHFGWGGYSNVEKFYSGSIFANVWYTPTLALVVGFEFWYSKQIKWEKTFIILFSLTFLSIILSGRRSALIIIVIALIIFSFSIKKKTNLVKILITIIVSLYLLLPFYEDVLMSQYEARTKRIEEGIEKEGRYIETISLWSDVMSFQNPINSLLGRDAFDTIGKYGSETLGQRYLHIDINIILFSGGLIGLFIYILIYLKIFREFLLITKSKFLIFINLSNAKKINLHYIFYSFFFASVALSFSGGLNAISFRTSVFITLGAIIGHYQYLINFQKLEYLNENKRKIKYSNGSK